MELIPAIDLLGGAVVRLAQGDYDRVTDYGDDPVAVARSWVNQGVTRLHLVDLEAARDGTRSQAAIIERIVSTVGVPCQVAGGIRDADIAATLLDAGVDRVVLGTALIRDPGLARVLVDRWGSQRVVAAIDVRDGQAVGDGWTAGAAGAPAFELIARLLSAGLERFAVTAIARDGLLTGPDTDLLAQAAVAAGGARWIIASAGVSSLEDVRALATTGYGGAILGRALYEGRIDLAEAMATVRVAG
jgi:phosphoribosylformimino-5-aminoimidazole carboxamide ribotide isomerase